MATNEKGHNPWECWVCQTKGRTIRSLLKQLNTPKDQAALILKYLPKGSETEYTGTSIVELPKEYQRLDEATNTSVVANLVKKYLYDRGLTDNDFIKYGIGYCTSGEYGGRVILPSYSGSNRLNYFVGRSFDGNYFKYKNPESSKDIVFYENLINWDCPIILCEGVFDAIAIRRNAIPILGKSISNELWRKILTSKLTDIYIALDLDAQDAALKMAEKFIAAGFRVFLIELPGKDPSEMGFQDFTKLVQNAIELDFSKIMLQKLNL
jgi:DNA primase